MKKYNEELVILKVFTDCLVLVNRFTRKNVFKKIHKNKEIRMPPLTVFSPEQIEIFRKRPRIERKNVIFFILDARAPPESIFQF